jgi:hypothetical protein
LSPNLCIVVIFSLFFSSFLFVDIETIIIVLVVNNDGGSISSRRNGIFPALLCYPKTTVNLLTKAHYVMASWKVQ